MSERYINYEEITLYLEDIKGYVESYLYSLNVDEKNIDKEEINMYLSIVPEIINKIEELVDKIYEEKSN